MECIQLNICKSHELLCSLPLVMTNSFITDKVQLVKTTYVRSWNRSALFFKSRNKSGKFAGTLSEMK